MAARRHDEKAKLRSPTGEAKIQNASGEDIKWTFRLSPLLRGKLRGILKAKRAGISRPVREMIFQSLLENDAVKSRSASRRLAKGRGAPSSTSDGGAGRPRIIQRVLPLDLVRHAGLRLPRELERAGGSIVG